jgi:RloB-like protein
MARQFSDLRRRPSTRSPKARIVLVCEGKNTEPDYFRALRQNLSKQSLEIKVVEAAGVPMTVAQEALRQAKILKDSVGSEGDRVCAIFDRDEHPKFDEAIEFCRRHKIMVGYTNPCFELWLIWHFENYGANSHRHDVQNHFRGLVPQYDPKRAKTADFSKLMDGLDKACRWSQHHFDARVAEGALYGAPSSQLHEVIACIRSFD